jgi:hypothetical membrane protein
VAAATLPHAAQPSLAQWLALGALVGPVLFTLAWLWLGSLQPATSTPYGLIGGLSGSISTPISGIGVGPNAALFNAAFVVCGLLQLVGATASLESTATRGLVGAAASPESTPTRGQNGLRRASLVLLALSPLALALVGVFTLANALLLHIALGMLLFASPVLSFVVTGLYLRRRPAWRRFGTLLLLASPLTLLLFVAYSLSFDQSTVAAGQGVAGATERILLLEIQAWYIALAWRAFRRT